MQIVRIYAHRIHPLAKSVTVIVPAGREFYYVIEEQSGGEMPVRQSYGFWRFGKNGWERVPFGNEAYGYPDMTINIEVDDPFDRGCREAIYQLIYENEINEREWKRHFED